MREIKFRAWDKSRNRMILNYAHVGKNGKMFVAFDLPDMDLVPMQFTGLKDKNGKEIWEGDIVKYLLPTLKKWCVGRVEWSEYWIGYFLHGNEWSDPDWERLNYKEVIGNIFENQELLSNQSKERKGE